MRVNRYFSYFKIFIILNIIWFFLLKEYNIFFISCGIISATFVLLLCYKTGIINTNTQLLKISALQYIFILISDVLKSTFNIVKIIYFEDQKINPVVRKVNVSQLNKHEKVLFANLVTMTPGTFVISVEGDDFLIHALKSEYLNFHSSKILNVLHKTR
jgi:multisubunit Na+/H+ antiporter MnhE subunit